MRKSIFTFIGLVAIASIILVGCGTTEPQTTPPAGEATEPTEEAMEAPETEVVYERSETFYMSGVAWGPVSDWNPFNSGTKANSTGTVGFVYETLFHYDPLSGVLVPWLAESGDWTDDTTYDLVLRDNLTWSDGEDLTADDVKFTYEIGQLSEAIGFSRVWKYLDSITVTDDTHLQFQFTDPLYQEWTYFLYQDIPIVPEHLWADKTLDDYISGVNENPIGSGAYLYETHSEDRNVWLRNDNWWGKDVFGLPAPKRIVDIRFSSNNVALGAVIKGEVDLSNNFLPGVATLSDKGYIKTYYSGVPYMVAGNTAVLFLNTNKPPMDDPAFRRALAFGIDAQAIASVAYANLVSPASPTGLLPTLSQFDDPDVLAELGYSYDPAEAASILEAAGYTKGADGFYMTPEGEAIELEVTCPFGWTDWMEAINVISSSAQAAGFNIKAETPEYNAWNSALTSGTFDMTLNNWAGMSSTPWTLYNLLFVHPIVETMNGGNFGRYENQEMFDLVDALAAVPVTDIEGMKAACADIQELMLTEMPMIPLWYNGLWAQYNDSVWTNWPAADADSTALPVAYHSYWQMGGMKMLLELEPVATE